MEDATNGTRRKPLPRAQEEGVLQRGHRPAHARVAQFLGGARQQRHQQRLFVVAQAPRSPLPVVVGQRVRLRRPNVGLDPVVDALARHMQQRGDVGHGAPLSER